MSDITNVLQASISSCASRSWTKPRTITQYNSLVAGFAHNERTFYTSKPIFAVIFQRRPAGLHADRHIARLRGHKAIAPISATSSSLILTSSQTPQETVNAAMLSNEVSSSSPEGRSSQHHRKQSMQQCCPVG